MPPYRTPVVKKPPKRVKGPAAGVAAAVTAATRTAARKSASSPRPRPQPTPAAKRPAARVKARAKAPVKQPPAANAVTAGVAKAARFAKHETPSQRRANAAKTVALEITGAVTKATRPHKLTKPIKTPPGLTGLSPADLKKKDAVGFYDPHPEGQEAGIDKAVHSTARSILRQVSRPSHAVAAGTRAAIHGDNVVKAAGRGAALKDPSTFSDVLGDLGVHNKALKSGGGLALDILTDPTTYVTLGTGVPAELSAKAAAKAALKNDATRGVRVGFKAHVPGTDKGIHAQTSGRATAAAGRKLKNTKLGQRAAQTNAKTRDALNETLAPDVTPSYRTRAEHGDIRDIERRARARIHTAERQTIRRGKALKQAVSEKQAAQVRTAIERKTEPALPTLKQRQVADTLRAEHAVRLKAKKARGLSEEFKPKDAADAQQYFPRPFTSEKTAARVTGGGRKAKADKSRVIPLPFEEAKLAHPKNTYVEDARQAETIQALRDSHAVNVHDMWQEIAATSGRKLTPNATIHPEDAVYELTPQGLKHAADAGDTKGIQRALKQPGDFVVMNRQSVDNVMKRIPSRGEHTVTRAYDAVQGRVKAIQTVYAPGYHARNLVGDSLNAWLHDTTGKSFLQARKALKAHGARNAFERSGEAVTAPGKKAAEAQQYLAQKVNVGKAGQMTLGDLVTLAEKHGAINTGQVAGEIRDLVGGTTPRRRLFRRGKTVAPAKEHRFSEYRENLPRLATFRQGLADGLAPEAAARHSLKAHIDYQDLTPFERKYLRRAFQFYTFFARNSRIQATRLIQRPGKYAAIQHVLDETAKLAGFQDYNQYADQLQGYEQKGLPIPLKYGGHVFPVFISPPTTDLNQLSTNAKEQLLQNFASRLSTWKTLGELAANRSIFFGLQPIKNGDQLTPAPPVVGDLPDVLKKKLGVQRILSHGKWVWGWDPRVDYAFRSLPQSNLGLQALKPTADDRGLNTNLSIGLSALTGIRVGPDRRASAAASRLYDERNSVESRMKFLRSQKGINADHPNAEYTRLSKRLKKLNVTLNPPKKKAGGGFFDDGGSSAKGSFFNDSASKSSGSFFP